MPDPDATKVWFPHYWSTYCVHGLARRLPADVQALRVALPVPLPRMERGQGPSAMSEQRMILAERIIGDILELTVPGGNGGYVAELGPLTYARMQEFLDGQPPTAPGHPELGRRSARSSAAMRTEG
jgi:hypothetical protein